MGYTVIFKKSTEKELNKIPKRFYLKIKEEVLSLADNPFPHGYIKLQDADTEYRIRVGDLSHYLHCK